MISFLDLKSQYNALKIEIQNSIQQVLDNTAFALGPNVKQFEGSFSTFCDSEYCIAVNSGTSALHVALLAHGIQPGDEVITVPNSFIATTWAITYCGATPVFVDVDSETWLMNPDLIEQAITPKTKAMIPVHLYGQPADMDPINNIAKKYGLIVIEDAAQAHAATYKGQKIGGLGNTTCFSFYPGKNLGAYGEGGAVVTNDENITKHIQKLRDHGQSEKYRHEMIGYNYRMDGIQGAVLDVKLKYLQEWTSKRNDIALRYQNNLNEIEQIQLPHIRKDSKSSFHLYVVHNEKRNDLMNYLNEKGIATGLHYPVSIHLQKAYKHLGYKKGEFPIAEKNAEQCLSFPLYPELPGDQIDYICNNINKYFK
jgi:dTDP-4-amino-4,6-dideoxygalactose transaminase